MRQLAPLLTLAWLLGACSGGGDGDDTGTSTTGAYCADVAMKTVDGELDPCDVAACEACADACDEPCLVLESYPVQYSCQGVGSWSVYDACPDWEMSQR